MRMPIRRDIRAVALACVLVAVIAIAGCSKPASSSSSTPTGNTAMAAEKVAAAALTTMAPGAKLLVGESAQPLTTTSTPIWEFLYGNPKTDVLYAVLVNNGKARAQEYGRAGLNAQEWSAVPGLDQWKVDSDAAQAAALKVLPSGSKAPFVVGFVTYVPKRATQATTKPLTWVFAFDKSTQGSAPTSTVNVDMNTGAASFAK